MVSSLKNKKVRIKKSDRQTDIFVHKELNLQLMSVTLLLNKLLITWCE